MMKFKTVVLCLKLVTCLIVRRGFGNIFKCSGNEITLIDKFVSNWKVSL